MKMYKLSFLILLLAVLFSNCKKEERINPELVSTMDFSNLEVGQKSYYTNYRSTCENYSGEMQWLADTLLMEVVSYEGNTYTFRESYTPHSQSFVDLEMPEPVEISVIFENDYLLLPNRSVSNFFWFYGNDTLYLQPSQRVNLVQENCQLILQDEPFIGNDIGKLSSFKIDDVKIKNKTAVSCVPGFFDVDAYLIYHEKSLQASHVIQGGNGVFGWVQLGI